MSKKSTGILIGLAAAGAVAVGTAAVIKYLSNKKSNESDFDDDFDETEDSDESRNYVNIPLDSEESDIVDKVKDAAENAACCCEEKVEDIKEAAKDVVDCCADKAEDIIDDIEDTLDDITE